jgi:hypothetical protein
MLGGISNAMMGCTCPRTHGKACMVWSTTAGQFNDGFLFFSTTIFSNHAATTENKNIDRITVKKKTCGVKISTRSLKRFVLGQIWQNDRNWPLFVFSF